jgi:glycogen phosphorylase
MQKYATRRSAGGLGVLAGDFLKASSDLGVPVVGVGLLYQEGYFRQAIDESGRQHEVFPYNDPTSLPIQPVRTPGGDWLRVTLALPGRTLYVRVWQARVGRATLYLLDTNDPLNGPIDRGITAKLYQGSSLVRFLQQAVLGIAGWRALEALGLDIDVCHMNEGHAALVVVERARAYMERTGLAFRDALWVTRGGNVFTTHTSVDAAFDRFDEPTLSALRPYLRDYAARLGVDENALLALGRRRPEDTRDPFTPAYLAIRGSASVNAVSRAHGDVSRRLLSDLFPRWPTAEVPVSPITNGVHVPSWDSPGIDALWEDTCGKERWRGSLGATTDSVADVSVERLWQTKADDRSRLVQVVRIRLARQLGYRGAEREVLRRAHQVFDAKALTLGFARRFVTYKRPTLLLHDPDRLERIITQRERPLQIVVAGKAHPGDALGADLIRAWIAFAARPAVRDRVVFLEDYDITLAEEMVRGVDVWLNTPLPPWEACGTSGMKVLANGGLNVSTLDGWWAEAYDPAFGWCIDAASSADRDAADAGRLYELLEHEIVPEFYARGSDHIPHRWVERMRASMAQLAPRFSANRMVREYLSTVYVPAAERLRAREADDGRLGKELRAWHARVASEWPGVHFGELTVTETADRRTMSTQLHLGGLDPADVAVELYADASGNDGPSRLTMTRSAGSNPGTNSSIYCADVPRSRPAADFTPRVIPAHPAACIPLEAVQILWYR